MSDFIHLHNHTHYSLQDGACTVDGLINAAKKHEMQSVAITDHGVMYGAAEFYNKAKKAGIKPIIGMEAYIVVDGSRFDRGKPEDANNKKKSKHYNHLILLAKNKQGYDNLSRLSTLGHTEGFYYKPRIDMELLEKYKEGLICTTACAGGVVSTHLVNDNYEKARVNAKKFKDLFGDDFYLEIQDHGMEIDKPILESMPKLSKELGIKLVATNDCHYIEPDHAIAHNILLLLSDKNGADYTQLRYGTDQVYFKSSDEMKKLFKLILNTIPRPILIRLSIVVRPILAFLLKGSRFTDPIDGKSFRMFLPYGYGTQRNNVLSPSTLSLERHRLLWLYLQNETDFFTAPKKVLHFAPEQEFYKRFKKQSNLDYTTTDLFSPLADVKADICNLPFENNSYDIILCNHVLEHIPDDTKAMQELYRVLKPGGMGIFQIPQDLSRATTFTDDSITDPKERAKIFGQYDHVRVYGRDYFDKLRSIGFKVDEVDYTRTIAPELVEKYCLAKGEIIPVCYK